MTVPAAVDALYRYPVKSMLGEQIDAAEVGERGILGDRAYTLVDRETGKVASAKHPRRWNVLLECRANYVDEPRAGSGPAPVRITLPDGDTVDSADPNVHERLSQAVGRPVRLESTPPPGAVFEMYSPIVEGVPEMAAETVTDEAVGVVAPGTFFDAAPLHVVTTASLAWLARLAPGSAFPAARFRPNVVVSVDGEQGFVENTWVHHTLHLGADIRASVFIAAPRCVMTTLAQPGLPHDAAVLQTVAHHNRFEIPGLGPRSCVGVYAIVAEGGTVRRADPVEIS